MLGPEVGNKTPGEFNVVFYDLPRLEALNPVKFWLSMTSEMHSSSW